MAAAALADEAKVNELLTNAFQAADPQGSGQLDEDGVRAVMTAIGSQLGFPPASDLDARGVVEQFDVGGGKVSVEELRGVVTQILGMMKAAAAQQ